MHMLDSYRQEKITYFNIGLELGISTTAAHNEVTEVLYSLRSFSIDAMKLNKRREDLQPETNTEE